MTNNFVKPDQYQFEMFPDETEKEIQIGRLTDRDPSVNLTEREIIIMKMRFGLTMPDGHGWTLHQIGKLWNLSRERVRQLEARALRKLRRHSEIQKLKPLLKGD
jgi:RNA polymerase primary sigma factor